MGIGYGDEDSNFVAELTYNYGVRTYKPGNVHIASLIKSDSIFTKALSSKYITSKDENTISLTSPCGYKFQVSKGSGSTVCGVRLSSTDLEKSKLFWSSLAKMNTEIEDNTLTAKYENSPIWVEFEKVDKINPEDNYGRTAIAWPTDGLKQVEEQVTEFGGKVLTPGKADVVVVIVADPD